MHNRVEKWKQPAGGVSSDCVWQNAALSACVETVRVESSRMSARIQGKIIKKTINKEALEVENSLLEETERPLPVKPWGHRSNTAPGSVLIAMSIC